MTAPKPKRGRDGRIIVKQREEDGRIVYAADDGSGWWLVAALPHVGNTELLYQVERAWNEAGVNPGHHAKMKREVRDRMPILAAYLDLLSAPQTIMPTPQNIQIRPRQSGKASEQAIVRQMISVVCPDCGAGPGVRCADPEFEGYERVHIKRYLAAGLGNRNTPGPKKENQ